VSARWAARQAAALDEAVARTDFNNNDREPDPVVSVLTEVPSTQLATPPPPCQRESRPREVTSKIATARTQSSKGRRPTYKVVGTTSPTVHVPPATTPAPSHTVGSYPVGRDILRLRAPPKVARVPAPRRRPPPCSEPSEPQWVLPVPPMTTVEFTAPTLPLEDSQLFSLQPEASQFQDADEDYRPLVES